MRKFLLAAILAIPWWWTLNTSTAAASPPLPCSETGAQLPLNLTHGNPTIGLNPAPAFKDYNYLFVSPTSSCPVTPSHVNLVATLSVTQILPAIGQPGRTPTTTDAETFWFTFHSGTGATGFSVTPTTETGDKVFKCHPPNTTNTMQCVTLYGTDRATLTYDGPDVFKGSYGAKITVIGPSTVTLDESLVLG